MTDTLIGFSSIFTCHVCKRPNEQRTIEWPPMVFACANEECGALYRFQKEFEDGTVKMKLIYRKYQ